MSRPYTLSLIKARGKECFLCSRAVPVGVKCINLVMSFNAILGIKVTKDEEIHVDCVRSFVMDVIDLMNRNQ